MSERRAPDSLALIADIRLHTRHAMAAVGIRLARSLASRFGLDQPSSEREIESSLSTLAAALHFAHEFAASLPPLVTPIHAEHPLQRLASLPREAGRGKLLTDLILLACLPEAHEGFSTLCRLVHPQGEAQPSVALALHWLEWESAALSPGMPFSMRDQVEDLLRYSPLVALGLVRMQGSGPWHTRNLFPGPGVWEALMARTPELEQAVLLSGYSGVPGLDDWLAQQEVMQAVTALSRGVPCQIALAGGNAAMRATRARALLGAANRVAIRTSLDGSDAQNRSRQVADAHAAAFMHQACLWLDVADDGQGGTLGALSDEIEPGLPVLATAANERLLPTIGLPLIRLPVEALAPLARRALWASLLPQLGEQANWLAARYPIDPDDARDVVRDLGLRQEIQGDHPLDIEQIGACVRARTAWHGRPGISRVLPRAGWEALLLPESEQRQLHSAVRRVQQQITVLDDWGFAQGRQERRGVRMLFHGSPGTGKTLAAEVMARSLGVDLLVVDIASLVSKWIGETEKNLAAVFDIAERSRALLLFDEADALFAKRTDTQDANDRYANLETAFLLQRLERYEGVAVLTTNLRSNLDSAFSRRFEFIVEFPEPDAVARLALWRLHLPRQAPLADDVDLAELAEWYAISGAQIKNASLSAAFFAASAAGRIHQRHFLLAIEREFDKAGKAHPGFPAHYVWMPEEEAFSFPDPTTANPTHAAADMPSDART